MVKRRANVSKILFGLHVVKLRISRWSPFHRLEFAKKKKKKKKKKKQVGLSKNTFFQIKNVRLQVDAYTNPLLVPRPFLVQGYQRLVHANSRLLFPDETHKDIVILLDK